MPTVGLGEYKSFQIWYSNSFILACAGTWKSQPGAVEHAVEFALKNGYLLVDTAAAYGNEKEVGEGIKASGVSREGIFLTTKLNNPDHKHPAKALESSLENLGTSYLDLCWYLLDN